MVHANSYYVPPELHQAVHVDRFLNVCFPFIDQDTGRKYPGIIDLAHFTEERLTECYLVPENSRVNGYRLEIESPFPTEFVTTRNFVKSKMEFRYPVMVYREGEYAMGNLYVKLDEVGGFFGAVSQPAQKEKRKTRLLLA